MLERATYIVTGRLGELRVRDTLAEAGSIGHEVTTLAGVAGRLAGGFMRAVGGAEVREALQEPPLAALTSLREVAELPGFAHAAARTLGAAWHAGLDLQERAAGGGRWAELAALERHVEEALPKSALLPQRLVGLARGHVSAAPRLLGKVTLERLEDLPPLYRPLLADLAERVPTVWRGAQATRPSWLPSSVTWLAPDAFAPATTVVSCADPEHEALEALRWVRRLLSRGVSAPEIAIAAVDVTSYDDALLALAKEADLPLHAAHGVPLLETPAGQVLAALADALTRGLSQQRVRRIVAAAQGAQVGPLALLPQAWADDIEPSAALASVVQWRRALSKLRDRERLQAEIVERLVDDLAKGLPAARQVGEKWLHGGAAALWRRALGEGPVSVLERSLQRLRLHGGADPAASVVWAPAAELLSWPRPHVRLLGLSARSWPRRAPAEDALLPSRLLQGAALGERSVAKQDSDHLAALLASTSVQLVASWPRRGADGRRQARSPLLRAFATAANESVTLKGGATHALSEADRRASRPTELEADPRLGRARRAFRSAFEPELTPHDGVVRPHHPAIEAALGRLHSATSLKTLLLNPHAFVARYALGWKRPEPQREPLALDPAALGTLLHEVLQATVTDGATHGATHGAAQGAALGDAPALASLAQAACRTVGEAWETRQPVPPPVLWRSTLGSVARWAAWALVYGRDGETTMETYAELRFGYVDDATEWGGSAAPWSPSLEVRLPGTDLRVCGVIDRLDIDRHHARVRVIDYKTGKPRKPKGGLEGGEELQRTLYTLAVRSLLGEGWQVEALLLHPRHQAAAALDDPGAFVPALAQAAKHAADLLMDGHVVAGPGLASPFEDARLAFPALGPSRYLEVKAPAIQPLRAPLDALLRGQA